MSNSICKKELCTACYCCVNACPVGCITMQPDDDMSIRPVIDSTKCINCKLCETSCPANQQPEMNSIKKTYAAFAKNEEINRTSTSGGLATILATSIINRGGIVYATTVTQSLDIEMKRCTTQNDILHVQGSKYVHSHLNDSPKQIESDLLDNKEVLVIGTPCQIAGVKAYLKKDYEKLFTIDVLCHGAPDQNIFKEYSKAELGERYELASNVSFRDSKPFATGVHYILKYFDKNNEQLTYLPVRASSYYWCFLYGHSFRECCYHCPYTSESRVGDMTLGDFWGFDDEKLLSKKNDGISLVLINNDKGSSLFERIKDKTEYIESDVKKAIPRNKPLTSPEPDTAIAQKFRELCKNGDVVYALNNCDEKTYKLSKLRKFVYKHKILFKLLLKIPKIKEKL